MNVKRRFLVVSANQKVLDNFCSHLMSFNMLETFAVTNKAEANQVIDDFNVDMVFVDIQMYPTAADIMRLKNKTPLKFTPIILIGDEYDPDDVAMRFHMTLINGFLDINSEQHTLLRTVKRLVPITHFNSETDKLMTNFIRASLRRVGAQEYSLSMVTKAFIMCKFFEFNREETFACVSALKYLSSVIATNSDYKKEISFFLELGYNNRTSEVLEEISNPVSDAGQIAFAILNTMRIAKDGYLGETANPNVDSKYIEMSRRLFDGYAVLLQSGYDIEMVVERVTALLFKYHLSDQSDDFMNQFTLLLTKILLFANGGIVMTHIVDNALTISIEPDVFNRAWLEIQLTKISCQGVELEIDAVEKKLIISLIVRELNSVISSNTTAEHSSSYQTTVLPEAIQEHHHHHTIVPIIMAKEGDVDFILDDITETRELIEDIDSTIIRLFEKEDFSSESARKDIEDLIKLYSKYSFILGSYPVFDILSRKFFELSCVLRELLSFPNVNILYTVIDFFESMTQSLVQFQKDVLELRVVSPNFFDESLSCDIDTIISIITQNDE